MIDPTFNPQDVWIVRPGDYVALIHKDRMTDQARHRAKTVLEERWPDVRCVFFEGDWDIKVLRPDDTSDPSEDTALCVTCGTFPPCYHPSGITYR